MDPNKGCSGMLKREKKIYIYIRMHVHVGGKKRCDRSTFFLVGPNFSLLTVEYNERALRCNVIFEPTSAIYAVGIYKLPSVWTLGVVEGSIIKRGV